MSSQSISTCANKNSTGVAAPTTRQKPTPKKSGKTEPSASSTGKGKMPTPHKTADANPDLASRMQKLENMLGQLVETVMHSPMQPSCFQPQADEYVCLDGGEVSPNSHGRDDSADLGGIDRPEVSQPAKRESIPSIAAKFAVNTGVGPSLDDELASSVTYLRSHSLEEKVLEETSGKYHSLSNQGDKRISFLFGASSHFGSATGCLGFAQ